MSYTVSPWKQKREWMAGVEDRTWWGKGQEVVPVKLMWCFCDGLSKRLSEVSRLKSWFPAYRVIGRW